MKFSIITPTYKRPTELLQAVNSVLEQSITDWELIIVNDSPGDNATLDIAKLQDSRIKILENNKNEGVNFSRNRGLNALSAESSWVIFLDDDDRFAPNALTELDQIISDSQAQWIVTARGTDMTTATTTAPKSNHYYSYVWDYLITRRFKGDATHCVSTNILTQGTHKLRFPTLIRQAEEWLFYSELGSHARFYYKPIVTTLTSGYAETGLNLRTRTMSEQLRLIPTIIREANGRHLYLQLGFWLYVTMRFIRAFIK